MENGLTKYEKYMRTEELLSLQKDERDLCRPEELTIQIIHQICELHYKLTLQYLELGKAYMEAKCLSRSIDELRKVDSQLKHLLESLNLTNVIRSRDYLYIHKSLGLGSTMDSPGYIALFEKGPSLWQPFKNLLDERGITVSELLRQGDSHYELFLLLQEMISFDELFQVLRNAYIKRDSKLLGTESHFGKDNSFHYSEKYDKFKLFPEIWKAISEQTQSN